MSAQLVLRKLVELAGGPAQQGYVLALDGEGLDRAGDALTAGNTTYTVVRPTSEVMLRHTLWKLAGAPLIALVSEELAKRLPSDLVRSSQGSRVHSLDVNDVLEVVLGMRVVGTEDESLKRLALEHLDDIRRCLTTRTLPTVMDRRLLDELLLDVLVGGRIRTACPGELLAEWLQNPPRWEPTVGDLVRRQLSQIHGLEGRILAWSTEKPGRAAALIERGVLLGLEGELPAAVWGDLAEAPRATALTPEAFRRSAVELVRRALTTLDAKAAPLLTRAEKVARRQLTPAQYALSPDLPLGLATRAENIVFRIVSGEPVAATEIAELREHRAAASRLGDLDVLDEMARLGRFLHATREDAPSAVADQVRHYQRHGAFADWSALRLRRALAANATYQKQATVLLELYRSRRDDSNRAFGETLAKGYVKALHDRELVALHRIWTSPLLREARFWSDDNPSAGPGEAEALYLVVLDGCSTPVFLELLAELTAAPAGSLGLGLGPNALVASGIPAVSPLPTITSHARGAIFLGELPGDPWLPEGIEDSGSTDRTRFSRNQALRDRTRQLFLKNDLADGGARLMETLGDPGQRVVAAVFNAVDDLISSANTGATLHVRAAHVAGLLPSIRAALSHDRRVVLTADHGHTLFWGTQQRDPGEGGVRFTALAAGEKVREGFIEIDDEGCGGQPGRKAFAWKMGLYRGQPQVGFHGGCSLEEMVVPLARIVAGGVPADEPSWWYSLPGVEPTVSAPQAEVAVAPAVRVARAAPLQADLFDRDATNRARAAIFEDLGFEAALSARLDVSERAALVLLHEVQSARVSEIAKAIGRKPDRTPGLMSRLYRKLHEAGVTCLRRETLPDGEDQYVFVPPPR